MLSSKQAEHGDGRAVLAGSARWRARVGVEEERFRLKAETVVETAWVSRSEWFRLKVQDGELEAVSRSEWLRLKELWHANASGGLCKAKRAHIT